MRNLNWSNPAIWISGIILALIVVALAVGGVWLIVLGGFWYYLIVAVGMVVSGILLAMRAKRSSPKLSPPRGTHS